MTLVRACVCVCVQSPPRQQQCQRFRQTVEPAHERMLGHILFASVQKDAKDSVCVCVWCATECNGTSHGVSHRPSVRVRLHSCIPWLPVCLPPATAINYHNEIFSPWVMAHLNRIAHVDRSVALCASDRASWRASARFNQLFD